MTVSDGDLKMLECEKKVEIIMQFIAYQGPQFKKKEKKKMYR